MPGKRDILILTRKFDPTADIVVRKLTMLREKVKRLNSDDFPIKAQFSGFLGSGVNCFEIQTERRIIESDKIKSAWFRQPFSFKSSDEVMGNSVIRFIDAECLHSFVGFMRALDCFWINRPDLAIQGSYKIFQLTSAKKVGLKIPQTLVTNCPASAKRFIGDCPGDSITKSITAAIIKSETKPRAIFTRKISGEEIVKVDNVKYCPTLFQNYVTKRAELRIIFVCGKIFSFIIYNQESPSEATRVDWRHYDFKNVRHDVYKLPIDIEEKICNLMKLLNLNFGAIDMILTPDGEFVFLEVNPTGQWGWLEELTGIMISNYIVEILVNPPTTF